MSVARLREYAHLALLPIALLLTPGLSLAYPKVKVSGYTYRVECWGSPDEGGCRWVGSPEAAAAQWLSGRPTFISGYSYPCTGSPSGLCDASCAANWVLDHIEPFSSATGMASATVEFRLVGGVGNQDLRACVTPTQTARLSLYRENAVVCPPGYVENPQDKTQCICPAGTDYVGSTDSCKRIVNRSYLDDNVACRRGPAFGEPIYPTTGSERLELPLGGYGRAGLSISYDSRRSVASNKPGAAMARSKGSSFGALWESNLHRSLEFDAEADPTVVQAWRGMGRIVSFVKSSGEYVANADVNDRLTAVSSGWLYVDSEALAQETYDATGRIMASHQSDGGKLTFTYSDANTSTSVAPVAGLLIEVRDSFDRMLQFAYEQSPVAGQAPRVRRIVFPGGWQSDFSYDGNGNLAAITWPDSTVRQFLYENGGLPWALTAVVDELGKRTHSISYDTGGRAYLTQAAGGVDRHQASWTTPPGWLIADTYDPIAGVLWRDFQWNEPQGILVQLPNGQFLGIGVTAVLGMPRTTSMSQPAGSGCGASISSTSYDSNGNVVSRDDFDGNRTCFSHDLSRNLEVARVQGLPGGAVCDAVTAAGAVLPAGSRKTSTEWHPDWPLPIRVAEPGRMTTYVYNGQPDPFAGGAASSCAPATARLPDGQPIAVLCMRVEQATTDADGALGLVAGFEPNVPARATRSTYNALGQLLTRTDPLGHTTSYAYHADTAFSGSGPAAQGRTAGDLAALTSPPTPAAPQGLVTHYTAYDPAGQVLQVTDPNGVPTYYTYDARQRLTSTTVAGQTTVYEYGPTGQLRRITQPDGSSLSYGYDDAHRLTRVSDNLGHSVTYTLDDLGNRTAEEVRDPDNSLRRSLRRSIDALGRVQQVTGGE